ncbi:guanine nucleotide-binding protein subunit beta-like protein 1 isoform X3 [Chiloscyllium plagiosum]|uniref:guanine nucleotide-binding protein subunit beta-like protein 1 isoform X3 n=1 Tax=Chiloscyllium plagiosum TaxID=36176 RepID=UPI001CB7BC84|nr:guanine nucleotide-binding protein subunit beta-like protein 1 isoform X3 [Chiloscyllium plagiosum]
MSDFCDNSMAIPPPDPKFVLRGTGASINTLHFCCSDQEDWNPILFSGSANGQIHIWNLKTHRADKVLESHNKQSVLWIHTLQGRNGLISQGRDAAVSTWDLSEGRTAVIDSIPLDSYGFCQCSLMQEGVGHYLLASPGSTSSEPPSGSRPLLLVGYENGSLTLWDLSEKKMLSHLACHNEPIMCLDFDPERAKGISGSSEKLLSSWGLDNQQNLKLQNAVTLVNAGIADTCIRQDKKILATAGWDHRIRIFGWKKLKPLAVLQYHIASVHCVTFSDHVVPCERLMAAGSKDQRISLWSVYNKP